MKYIFDSNVFISSLIPEETHHSYSKDALKKILKSGFKLIVPTIVLFEVFHSLCGKFGMNQSSENYLKFKKIFDSDRCEFIDLNMAFFGLYKSLRVFDRLKTSDSIVASSALLTDSTLITWDQNILRDFPNALSPEKLLEQFAA